MPAHSGNGEQWRVLTGASPLSDFENFRVSISVMDAIYFQMLKILVRLLVKLTEPMEGFSAGLGCH